jgi:hypothetical protein
MLLYNITIIVEEEIAEQWQNWMKEQHIPTLMAKAPFQSYRLFKIVDSPNEGLSFCVQFIVNTTQEYRMFTEEHEHGFTAEMYAKYPNKLLAFSTLMEHID